MATTPLKKIDLNPIELFAAQYLPHLLTENVSPVQRELTTILSDRDHKRIAIEFFRGGGKTTWANIIYSLYEICEGPYSDIQSVSASGGTTGLSTKVARKIRRELTENELLIYDYGIECGKGTEYFKVKRGDGHEVEMYCRGKGGAIRGSRGLVIIDDPQSIRDCQSATVLENDHYWFHDDVLPVLLKDQRLVFIGTSISPISLLATVKRKKGWKVVEFTVDDPVGSFRSVWPQMFPEAFLRQQFDDMGVDSFNAEYRCRPLVTGNPVFRDEWFQYYDPKGKKFKEVLHQNHFTILAADTAISKKKVNDDTAIVVMTAPCVGRPDYYVRECIAGKLSSEHFALKIMSLMAQYQPGLTWIECACNPPDMDGYVEAVSNKARIQNVGINLQWGHPSDSKLHRAFGVQGIVQSGRVFFDRESSDQLQLINDLRIFIGDDKFPDDRVDAFVHGLTEFKGWSGRGETHTEPVIVRSVLPEFNKPAQVVRRVV
jgi:hypothetical protein